MNKTGDIDRRNKLCLERIQIETQKLPYCHTDQRRRELTVRLQQINYEIELTYENKSIHDGGAGKQKAAS